MASRYLKELLCSVCCCCHRKGERNTNDFLDDSKAHFGDSGNPEEYGHFEDTDRSEELKQGEDHSGVGSYLNWTTRKKSLRCFNRSSFERKQPPQMTIVRAQRLRTQKLIRRFVFQPSLYENGAPIRLSCSFLRPSYHSVLVASKSRQIVSTNNAGHLLLVL